MKTWLSLLFFLFGIMLLSAGVVHAEQPAQLVPKLILDGKLLNPPVPPSVINQSVMIPVRIATESLGYDVNYDNVKKQVTVSGNAKKLVMTVDAPTAWLDDQPKQMAVPPTIRSQSMLIPLRFLGESLDVEVLWDNQSKSAFLYSPVDTTAPPGDGMIGVAPGQGGGAAGPGVGDDLAADPNDGGFVGAGQGGNRITGTVHEVYYEQDAVVLRYDGLIAPRVTVLAGPDRLAVDLPNADFAGDFSPPLPADPAAPKLGELLFTNHPLIKKVRYAVFAEQPRTLRFVLDLSAPSGYELTNDPVNHKLYIRLKEPDKKQFTVVLDAGHGGSDPGAISLSKRAEKEFNLSVVLKVQAILSRDERIRLVLTRTDDSYPSLADRSSLANAIGADLFVSVHANSFTAATNGTETYYTRPDSRDFAYRMHALLVAAAGLKDNGVRTANYHVTRETKMPAILLEIGYLSSKIDEPILWQDAFQNQIAMAIAQGIKQQLGLN